VQFNEEVVYNSGGGTIVNVPQINTTYTPPVTSTPANLLNVAADKTLYEVEVTLTQKATIHTVTVTPSTWTTYAPTDI
jgi:hypothetical protein